MRKLSSVFIILFSLAFPACAGSAYKLPSVTSEEAREAESRIASDASDLKVYKRSDADYKSRLEKISQRLQKNAKPLCALAEYSPCHFEVQYNNESIVNAYAYDEYKIVVFRGLLQYLKNDEEMAALVAHEMGHHLAKHNQEKEENAATGAAVSGILTAVLLAAANANNPYYDSYQQQQQEQTLEDMMLAGAEIGALSYSKEQEREADLLGAYLLKHAGYDLNKARGLLYTMARISGDDVEIEGKAALLSTHPPTSERYIAWGKAMQEIKANKAKLPYPNSNN
jgi:predicted Zn-dependent protease